MTFPKFSYSSIIAVLLFIIMIIAIGGLIYREYDQTINPQPLKTFEKGIQNHLLWDIKGSCFFVRPANDYTVYLIEVPDCNKATK